jgi:hypothetical protein
VGKGAVGLLDQGCAGWQRHVEAVLAAVAGSMTSTNRSVPAPSLARSQVAAGGDAVVDVAIATHPGVTVAEVDVIGSPFRLSTSPAPTAENSLTTVKVSSGLPHSRPVGRPTGGVAKFGRRGHRGRSHRDRSQQRARPAAPRPGCPRPALAGSTARQGDHDAARGRPRLRATGHQGESEPGRQVADLGQGARRAGAQPARRVGQRQTGRGGRRRA